MSGIHARSRNDKCAVKEYYADSMEPANYALELDYNVHPKFKTNKDVLCSNKAMGCKPVSNSNATMNLGPDSFGQRVSIEETLRGTDRILTKCLSGPMPNEMDSNSVNVITVNPRLFERDIVPTNMNQEYETGF